MLKHRELDPVVAAEGLLFRLLIQVHVKECSDFNDWNAVKSSKGYPFTNLMGHRKSEP